MTELTNVRVYRCEYCNKISTSKGGMVRHEIFCGKNPINHTPCASCEHLVKTVEQKKVDYVYPFGECEIGAKRTTMLCTKKNLKLYHPKVRRYGKEKSDKIISQCDMQMPTECEMYQWKKG